MNSSKTIEYFCHLLCATFGNLGVYLPPSRPGVKIRISNSVSFQCFSKQHFSKLVSVIVGMYLTIYMSFGLVVNPLLMPENNLAQDSPSFSCTDCDPILHCQLTQKPSSATSCCKSKPIQHQRCLLFNPLWLLYRYAPLPQPSRHSYMKSDLLRNGPKFPKLLGFRWLMQNLTHRSVPLSHQARPQIVKIWSGLFRVTAHKFPFSYPLPFESKTA